MFPEKTKWLKRPIGWQDLGEQKAQFVRATVNDVITSSDKHLFCGKTVHIGEEQGKLFHFCPRCLIKTKPNLRK